MKLHILFKFCLESWNFSTWQFFLQKYNLWYLWQIWALRTPRSNMRESSTSSFRGKDHCECEREEGWPCEDLQGDDWICSKKYTWCLDFLRQKLCGVLTCSDHNCLEAWLAQNFQNLTCSELSKLYLLRTFKTWLGQNFQNFPQRTPDLLFQVWVVRQCWIWSARHF